MDEVHEPLQQAVMRAAPYFNSKLLNAVQYFEFAQKE